LVVLVVLVALVVLYLVFDLVLLDWLVIATSGDRGHEKASGRSSYRSSQLDTHDHRLK
jgi:hypothetical protein